MLARRRRALIVLASAVVFSALLALVGALPGLLQLLCDLALVAYLWHLRTQARRRVSERAVRTRQASREAPPVHSRRPAARIPVEVAEVSAELAPAVGYGAAWDPVPVPPPSYVNQAQLGSPEAPQQMVDLTKAGTNMLEELGLWDDDDTQEFAALIEDELPERRRAVND